MGKISLEIDFGVVEKLKQCLNELGLNELRMTLDSLVTYVEEQVKNKLPSNSGLSDDEYNKKMTIINRKFRHMLDVPMLCVDRIYKKEYPTEIAQLLMIVAILHDIGRIDEIIGVDTKDFSTGKVNHSAIGADYLSTIDYESRRPNIYKFVPVYLADSHGELIINCVRHHGDYMIPENKFSSDLAKTLIGDLRILDKSSIMNSFLHEDMSTIIQISLEELSRLSIDDVTFSELVSLKSVDRKKAGVEYTRIRHFLSHVGFIFDLPEYDFLEDDWVRKYMSMYVPNTNDEDEIRWCWIVHRVEEYMKNKGYVSKKNCCRRMEKNSCVNNG